MDKKYSQLYMTKKEIIMFDIITGITYILFIAYTVGYYPEAKKYMDIINSIVRIFISLLLLWKFNPFNNEKFTQFDKKIVFYAGSFLFSTTIIYNIIIYFLKKTVTNAKSII